MKIPGDFVKIWTVTESDNYTYSSIVSIHQTQEGAVAFAEDLVQKDNNRTWKFDPSDGATFLWHTRGRSICVEEAELKP